MESEPLGDRRPAGHGQVLLSPTEAETAPPEVLAHIYRLSDPALSALGLTDLLDELLLRIREILHVDTAAILLIDDARRELVARAAAGLEEEVEQGVRIPVGRGFAGRIAVELTPVMIPDLADADVVNPILRQKGLTSMLGVPLIVERGLIGVLHVGSLEAREFTLSDASVLQLAAARAAPAIEHARVLEALEREHSAAVALQRSLLPDRLPDEMHLATAARYLPARDEVGGDWYDFVSLPDHRIGLAIGDVAGHGVRATALMGQMRASLRAYAIEGHPPAVALTLLDRLLRMTRDDAMATAIYAVVDTDTGTVTYASAGHLPPLIIGPDGSRFAAPATGPPVGVVADPDYGEAELSLAPGETMLFYTDGLVEVRGESLDVGLARLQAAAEVITDPEVLCDHVSGKLVPREGSEDDVALVAIQSRPIGTELDLSVKAAPGALAPMRRTLRRWLEMVGATAEETGAIVLACGEASANAVEHAYGPGAAYFRLNARCDANVVEVRVSDSGRWRDHRGENRGRGEYIMRATMDSVNFERSPQGTQVVMQKVIVGA